MERKKLSSAERIQRWREEKGEKRTLLIKGTMKKIVTNVVYISVKYFLKRSVHREKLPGNDIQYVSRHRQIPV